MRWTERTALIRTRVCFLVSQTGRGKERHHTLSLFLDRHTETEETEVDEETERERGEGGGVNEDRGGRGGNENAGLSTKLLPCRDARCSIPLRCFVGTPCKQCNQDTPLRLCGFIDSR